MIRTNLSTTAVTLMLSAFGFGLLPMQADALPAAGSAGPIFAGSGPTIQIAYVKKKIVVKKKGVKKTTVVITHRRPGHAYGFYTYHPHVYGCRSVVRYVKSHNRMVKVVRRVC